MTERVRGEEALIFSELHFCFVHLLPAILLFVKERENEKRFSKELSLVQHDYWTHKEDKKVFLS